MLNGYDRCNLVVTIEVAAIKTGTQKNRRTHFIYVSNGLCIYTFLRSKGPYNRYEASMPNEQTTTESSII
jgi:hypothetical protein